MDAKERIEIARAILVNAIEINMNKETIQKISEELDKYILDYYQKEMVYKNLNKP